MCSVQIWLVGTGVVRVCAYVCVHVLMERLAHFTLLVGSLFDFHQHGRASIHPKRIAGVGVCVLLLLSLSLVLLHLCLSFAPAPYARRARTYYTNSHALCILFCLCVGMRKSNTIASHRICLGKE